jgi:hypothetical protein
MKKPDHDEVLLTGTDERLHDYIEESGLCLVVDWRGAEQDLIDNVSELLPDRKLAWEWVDAEDDLYILYQGQRYKVGLTMSGRDRYITLRKLNEVMASDYEIRGFRHTLEDDTHCFYVKPCAWWTAMEEHFPKDIARVFAQITPEMDFPDYRR